MSDTLASPRSRPQDDDPHRASARPGLDAASRTPSRSEGPNSAAGGETTIAEKLKAVGVDADALGEAAKDQASELQRILTDEMQRNPLRTLGIAAAIGLFVGLLTTR